MSSVLRGETVPATGALNHERVYYNTSRYLRQATDSKLDTVKIVANRPAEGWMFVFIYVEKTMSPGSAKGAGELIQRALATMQRSCESAAWD